MATQKELDAYFGGSPSYELYKKLYGGSGSNAGQINNLYDQQIAQQNAYYDAQLQKLAGQNAQQQQALAAENMRAGRGIRYATTQGGLNNSGIQAQAGVLNAIAGQKAQGTLAAQYQQSVADIEADRAQKAYGLDINRQQALLNDQAQAQQRQATYAGILSGYEQRMANEEAVAAQAAQTAAYQAEAARNAALNANALIYRDAADLESYYRTIADQTSEAAQNIINTYGQDAYNAYVQSVSKKLSGTQTTSYNSLTAALENMAAADAVAYYDDIAYDTINQTYPEKAQEIIASIGQANYDKLVKSARTKAAQTRGPEEKNDIINALRGLDPEYIEQTVDYYNLRFIPSKYNGAIGNKTAEDFEYILKEMIKAEDALYGWITTAELNAIFNDLDLTATAAASANGDPRTKARQRNNNSRASNLLEDYTSYLAR